jgi:hypothetical protein
LSSEAERLRTLRALNILDTPSDERFDRVVRLARRVFDVPIAVVGLVDEDRQWNKAVIGVPQEFPRDESICTYTIQQDGPLVVPDLREDRRFQELPTVVGDPGLRFYAGYPLTVGGERVGTLCVMDDAPREFSERDIDLLTDLARGIERDLASSDELVQAATVQRQLLPTPTPRVAGYEVVGHCEMAHALGGDFFDWLQLDDDHFQLALADVMGKGVGAALIAASTRAMLRGASRYNPLPRAVERTAGGLEGDFAGTGSFVTAFVGRLTLSTGELQYIDAGHGLAVVLSHTAPARVLETGGLPLGVLPAQTWESRTTTLAPEEMLVVVSDGILDLFGTGQEAFEALVNGYDEVGETGTAAEITAAILKYATEKVPTDDVTIVAVRRLPIGES